MTFKGLDRLDADEACRRHRRARRRGRRDRRRHDCRSTTRIAQAIPIDEPTLR
jgi:hypothetical protein